MESNFDKAVFCAVDNVQSQLKKVTSDIKDIQSTLSDFESIADAETDRIKHEEQRQLDESSRVGAETHRVQNETKRVDAETGRIQSEQIRVTSENNRKAKELSRQDAENDRQNNESTRQNNEKIRQDNENSRLDAETTRVNQENLRVSTEIERTSNETTRINNETQRSSNEENRINTESDRVKAESARVSAETTRENNENTRISNEATRIESENIRNTNEEQRASAESTRVDSEETRVSSENTRISNETKRIKNETSRINYENTRTTNENTRIASEKERNSNETERINSEKTRVNNENSRIVAEEQREKVIADAKNTVNEAAAVNAELNENTLSITNRKGETKFLEFVDNSIEEVRQTNEKNRDAAEQTRVENESARVSAEENRAKAESSRVTAENDRVKSENSRITTETERINAEDSRIEAENARVEAENTRNSNENARADAETKRVSAETARVKAETQRTNAEIERESQFSSTKAACETATENANTATTNANNAAASANTAAINAKADYVGTDNYVYRWDSESSTYKKTNLYVKGDKGDPGDSTAANTAAEKANAAADKANTAANQATSATNSVNTAIENAIIATQNANTAAKNASDTALSIAIMTPSFVGFSRENGADSPDAQTTYGSKDLIHEIGSHLHLMTVKNGKPQHIMEGGRLTKATNGDTVAIDGSDGDVYVGWDMDIQLLKDTQTIDSKETNVIGLSLAPAYWHGKLSKRLPKHGISAMGEVYGKLDGDTNTQQHCIYNTNIAGTYSDPQPIFKGSYKKSGGGYPTQYTSCVQSIQHAQAKNTDPFTRSPYLSEYYEFYEAWCALFFAEAGSVDVTTLDKFGSGLTPRDSVNATTFNDDTISANSGWKVMVSDTVTNYYNVWGNEIVSDGTTKYNLVGGIAGTSWFGIVEMLEPQRVLDAIAAAGLLSYIGSKTHIFFYADDGTMQVSTDGSIDVSTGTGMTALKHYFIVRGVDGFEGMADGVMTAVVNSYTLFEFADNIQLTKGGTSLTGKKAILKRSMAVYRGKILPYCYGVLEQTDGAFYIAKVDSDGNQSMEFRCAASIDDLPARKTFGFEAPVDEEADIEKGLSLRYVYASLPPNESYVKKANYSLSLFCAEAFGSGDHTGEAMYVWLYPNNNAGKGKRQVHGFVVGCHLSAWAPRSAVRTVAGADSAGDGYDIYVGASAVLLA